MGYQESSPSCRSSGGPRPNHTRRCSDEEAWRKKQNTDPKDKGKFARGQDGGASQEQSRCQGHGEDP